MNLIASAQVPDTEHSVQIYRTRHGYSVGTKVSCGTKSIWNEAAMVPSQTTARTVANMLYFAKGNVSKIRKDIEIFA